MTERDSASRPLGSPTPVHLVQSTRVCVPRIDLMEGNHGTIPDVYKDERNDSSPLIRPTVCTAPTTTHERPCLVSKTSRYHSPVDFVHTNSSRNGCPYERRKWSYSTSSFTTLLFAPNCHLFACSCTLKLHIYSSGLHSLSYICRS